MDQDLRGTGRTYRMLLHAIQEAEDGKYVLIYVDSIPEFKRLLRELQQFKYMAEFISPSFHIGQKIRINQGQIAFDFINDRFDWQNLRARGVHPSVVTLLDHHTIEARFSAVLDMLNRFNEAESIASN